MPLLKPQSMKSMHTISLQPQNMTPKIVNILYADLAGHGTNEISRMFGMTASRVSIIKGSPLYKERREIEAKKLQSGFMDKQATRLVEGDPVEQALKGAALDAANKKIALMKGAKSEFVQSSAANDILDRAGYKAHQEKTKLSVELTEKMANRFERVMSYGNNDSKGERKITLETEVS